MPGRLQRMRVTSGLAVTQVLPQEQPDSISPVPKGEGPGAPSAWFVTIVGTGATRQMQDSSAEAESQYSLEFAFLHPLPAYCAKLECHLSKNIR
jgi:hypothetical protein